MTDTRGNPKMLKAAVICLVLGFVVLFFATSGACQDSTAPRPELGTTTPKTGRASLTVSLFAMGVGQGLDTVTTLGALQRGAVERNPLAGPSPSAAKLVAYKAPLAVVGWLLAAKVHPRHPKLAKGTMWVIGGVGAGLAIHNSRVARGRR